MDIPFQVKESLELLDEDDGGDEAEWSNTIENTDNVQKGNPFCDGSHQRTIVHLDIDCFYAQVEMIENPELRNKPIGVRQKNFIATTNYVARNRGVAKGLCVQEAKKVCSDLVLINGEDLTKYRRMSYKITECLRQFDKNVERLGFDENYLDVSQLIVEKMKDPNINLQHFEEGEHTYGCAFPKNPCACGCHERLLAGFQVAREMRKVLHDQLGITGCAGVAWNKLLAKLVGTTHKPNQQTLLFPCYTDQLLVGLSTARKIPGIGPTTSKKLQEHNIVTVQDVQRASLSEIGGIISTDAAGNIKQLVLGIDNSPVINTGKPQSISLEDRYKNCTTVAEVKRNVSKLIQGLQSRIDEDGRTPLVIRVSVRKVIQKNEWTNRESRQCPIPSNIRKKISSTDEKTAAELLNLSMSLLEKMVNLKMPFHISLLNICFTNFEDIAKPQSSIESFLQKSPTSVNNEKKKTLHLRNKNENVKKVNQLESWLHFKRDCTSEEEPVPKKAKTDDCKNQDIGVFKEKQDEVQGDLSAGNECNTRIALPKDIDESVFNELPSDIQETVLQEYKARQNTNNHVKDWSHQTVDFSTTSRPTYSTTEMTESLITCTTSTSDSPKNETKFKQLPNDIDKAVFQSLPLDVQQDLMRQWKIQSNISMPKTPKSLKPDKKTKSPNILNFFKK